MTERAFAGPGVEDQDADVVPIAASPLDALKEALGKVRGRSDIIDLPHPGNAEIRLHFNRKKVADYDNLNAWQTGSQTDRALFICTVLKETSIDIVVDGKPLGFTLDDERLCTMVGVVDQIAAVKEFFAGNFYHYAGVMADLVAEAGKVDDGLDPTTTSKR